MKKNKRLNLEKRKFNFDFIYFSIINLFIKISDLTLITQNNINHFIK